MRTPASFIAMGLVVIPLPLYGATSPTPKAQRPAVPSKNTLNATQWLKRSQKAGQTLNFEGREITITWTDGKTDSAVVRRTHSGALERSEYLAPRSLKGRIFLSDQRTTRIYNPVTKTIAVTPRSKASAINLGLLLKNYHVLLDPKPRTQADRLCRIVRLQPRTPGKPRHLIWLDSATGLNLKQEHFNADGSPAGITQFTEIRIGPAIPPARFKLPSQAREVQTAKRTGAAGLKPSLPHLLPAGYQLQECQDGRASSGWHCLYSDGVDMLSVFTLKQSGKQPASGGEKVRLGRREGTLQPKSHHWVVSWNSGRDRWALISSLSRTLALDIATVIASR